jgi:TonB family protein
VDKDFRVDKNNKTVSVKQPLPLPEGVENSAIEIITEDNTDKEIVINTGISAVVAEEDSDLLFDVVESMPQFPGGDMALHQFIGNNLIYPVKAQESGIQGRVILQFEIDEKGEIHNIVVVRSISKELDEEAIRILKSMPKWIPGKQRGKAVKVKYTLPISFRLK